MADYIERAPIMGALTSSEAQAAIRAMTGEEAYIYFLGLINAAPAADVAPVRHGKIVETIENGKAKRVFTCCGEDFTNLTQWYMPDYCPNCGAKMDGGPDVEAD